MEEVEGNKKGGQYPVGVRFKPSELELVKYYLLPKLEGRPLPTTDAVIEANVYAYHPTKLISVYKDRGENSWYFLSPRARKYENGVKPSRSTDDGLGRWKASTGKEESVERIGNGVTYSDSVLAYFEGRANNERKTKWLMQELTVPHYENKLDKSVSDKPIPNNKLDEFVMCRIYVSPRYREEHRHQEVESSTCTESGSPQSESVAHADRPGQLPPESKGKRRIEEQPCFVAATPKRLHLPSKPLRSSSTRTGQPAAPPNGQSGVRPCYVAAPNQPSPAPLLQRLVAPPNFVPGSAALIRPANLSGRVFSLQAPPQQTLLRPVLQPPPSPDRVIQQLMSEVRQQPGRYLNQKAIQQQGLSSYNHVQATQMSSKSTYAAQQQQQQPPPLSMMQQQQQQQWRAPTGYFLGGQHLLVKQENVRAGVIYHPFAGGYGHVPFAGYSGSVFSAPASSFAPAETSAAQGMMMAPASSSSDVKNEGYDDLQTFIDVATVKVSPEMAPGDGN